MSIIEDWFEKVKELPIGKSLWFRVADKKEQTRVANEIEYLRDEYANLEPVHASQLFVRRTLFERKQYVVVERLYRAPYTAFIRNEQGGFAKVSIDPERERMIKLMLKDGLRREDIERLIGTLSKDEVTTFFSEEEQ